MTDHADPHRKALVRIPMAGRVDSLNVAAATAVILYEVFGQRHPPCARTR